MCRERKARFFCPPKEFLIDNGGMIAYTGELLFRAGVKETAKNVDIKPRERTDDVVVCWR
jgi:tRNA A37 threonylcarbamoyltransferase TsaD